MSGWNDELSSSIELVKMRSKDLQATQPDHELLRFLSLFEETKPDDEVNLSPEAFEHLDTEFKERFWRRDEAFEETAAVKAFTWLLSWYSVALERAVQGLAGDRREEPAPV